MAQTLASLYVEFASKGIGTVKEDMRKLQQEMAASQNRAAALQSRLAKLSPKTQKTERQEILKQLLAEEAHMRTIQKLQSATGLKGQKNALEALNNSIKETERQAAKLRDRLKEIKTSSNQKQARLGQLDKKERKTGLNRSEIKERQSLLASLKTEKKERADIGKNLGTTESKLKSSRQLQASIADSIKSQQKGIKDFAEGVSKAESVVSGIAAGFKRVGVVATAAFGAGLASMLQLAAAADPTGWRMFRAEVEILQIHIGRIFIPILRQLTGIIQSISNWFKSLSPQQRQQVRLFAMIGMGVLALVGVIGTLGAAFLALIPIAATVISSISAMFSVATGGVGALLPIIGVVVTGLLSLMGVAVGAGGAMYVLGQKGESFGEKLKNAWNSIWTVVGPIVDKFVEGCKRIWAMAKVYFEMLGNVVSEFLDSFGTDWNEIWSAAQAVFSFFVDFVVEGIKSIGAVCIGLAEIMRQVGSAIKDGLMGAWNIIKSMVSGIMKVVQALGQIDWQHPIDSARRVADALAKAQTEVARTIIEQKNPMANFDMGKVQQKVDDFYRRATKAEQKAQKDHQAGKASGADDTPMARGQAPQLRDVAEVWRAAQTAQQNDPMLRVQQERLDLQRQALEQQRKTNEQLEDIRRKQAPGLRG